MLNLGWVGVVFCTWFSLGARGDAAAAVGDDDDGVGGMQLILLLLS